MAINSSRRNILKLAGTASLSAIFSGPLTLRVLAQTPDAAGPHDYSGWEKLYRDQWSWDKKTRGAHLINCTGACPHYVYTKDGVVLREEQSRDLPAYPDLPDFNPRGCNKGECGADYMYAAQRVKYPLIRTGERGEGKWRRATWDEALGMVATGIVDTIQKHAPDCISVFSPVPAVAPVSFSAGHRFAHLIGAHVHSFFDWYADHPTGQTQTCGIQGDTCESADWFNSKYIILWGANAAVTRIPDAHYLNEAALNGTRIVSITPDYNSTTIKADLWVHPKPGTDAALALGMAHVIIKEKLFDAHNMKEQTDLPYLVRSDSKRFLREADVVAGGSDARFYVWDTRTNKPVLAKGSWADQPEVKPQVQPGYLGRNTLTFPDGYIALGELDPALGGMFKVTLKDGKTVEVRPVFDIYKDRILREYSPAAVAKITGVAEKTIIDVAKNYATTKPAMIITGGGTNHWFYSDVMLRTFHLLSALTGSDGHNGGGINHYVGQWKPVNLLGIQALSFPQTGAKQRFVQTTIWTAVHGEVYDSMDNAGIDTRKFLRHSLETRQMPMYPRNGRDPKVFIVYRGNFLNQAKGQKYVLNNLWPKLDLIVNVNMRMDSTALYSDVVLPSAHWYEKTDLNTTDVHTYVNMTEPAIPPMHDSKSDWEIFALLARKVQEVAVERGMSKYFDEEFNWARDFSTLYDQQIGGGKLETAEQAAQFILDAAVATKGITLDQIREKGPQRFKANWTSPIKEGVPYTPFQFYVIDKKPWPTLTGRQQFYIDHDVFFEMGLELPVYKAPVNADKYPLLFNTAHSRHAIHSTFKDSVLMLRLQRGGPVLEMPPAEAQARGLRDNDWAEVWNDHGRLVCRVKIYNREPAGRVGMNHTPELYMDLIEGSTQTVCTIRINPTSLVGNYGHLVYRCNYYGPGGTNRDARVEVRRYTGVTPN